MTKTEARGGPVESRSGTPPYKLVVAGGQYVFRTHAGTISTNDDLVDLKVTTGFYQGTDLPGRFEVKGKKLVLAIPQAGRGGERPKVLTSEAGTTHYVYTMEKQDATPEQAAAQLKEMTAALPAGRGTPFARDAEPSTQAMLRQVLEKLDRIEKRLDELEKKK